MYYKIAILILLISLFSCNANQQETQENKKEPKQVVQKKKKRKKPKPKKPKVKKFTRENALAELTKYGKENPETIVLMKTNLGDIKIKLYRETPLHRANFIRLVKNNYYEGAMFYRVVKGFIVQTGGSDTPVHGNRKRELGFYNIPAEFKPHLYHKKGAMGMSRKYKDNPDKNSVPYDFYIVHGTKVEPPFLQLIEPEAKRNDYGTIGGADHLDNEHTVFGEVINGLEVVDKIANSRTDKGDWPIEDIIIEKIEIVK